MIKRANTRKTRRGDGAAERAGLENLPRRTSELREKIRNPL